MANRSAGGFLQHSNGTDLNATAALTADFRSSGVAVSGDWLGLAVTILNASGTSMTCDIKIEASNDDFTTTWSYPGDKNAGTQAAIAQFTGIDDDTASQMEYWINPFPHGQSWKWRAFFDFGGTIGTNTVTASYFTRNTFEEGG